MALIPFDFAFPGPAIIAAVILIAAAGCSSADLGQLDETRSERDDMSGPGIFAGESGDTVLKWRSDGKSSASAAEPSASPVVDDKAEFEQFKKWDRLRTEGKDSAEYREFLQWLKYQQFKAGQ